MLNALAKEIHADNHKWWHDLHTGARLDRNKGELLCLIHSEISEAFEGMSGYKMDDHLPMREMAEVELADAMIRILDYAGGFGYDLDKYVETGAVIALGIMPDRWLLAIHQSISNVMEAERKNQRGEAEINLAILVMRIKRFAERCGHDLDGAIREKRQYNASRADHQKEARLAAGGKKW